MPCSARENKDAADFSIVRSIVLARKPRAKVGAGQPRDILRRKAVKRVVDWLTPTAQKVWNSDIRLFPTFRALPENVQAYIKRTYGEKTNTTAQDALDHDKTCLVNDRYAGESHTDSTALQPQLLMGTKTGRKSIASQ